MIRETKGVEACRLYVGVQVEATQRQIKEQVVRPHGEGLEHDRKNGGSEVNVIGH